MSHVSLRPADQRDTDFARAAHHSAYRDVVMRQFGRWDEEAQDACFEGHWLSPGCVVITYDGRPCGYARLKNYLTKFAYTNWSREDVTTVVEVR